MHIDWKLPAIGLLLLTPLAHAGEVSTLPGVEEALASVRAEEKLDELEPVVIVGGLATPKMWKVSKGDHVMWVLGGEAIPAGVQWRFDQVDARISASQLVLYPGWPALTWTSALQDSHSGATAFKAAKNPKARR